MALENAHLSENTTVGTQEQEQPSPATEAVGSVMSDLERVALLSYRQARRAFIFAIGMTVVLIGVVMLVTPGPATVVIPIGVAILGAEFAWARSWLKRAKNTLIAIHRRVMRAQFVGRPAPPAESQQSAERQ